MSGGVGRLRSEVLDAGLCVSCGACVGLCPYLVAMGDRVACVEECRKDTGRCYRFCPRSGAPGADVTADAVDGAAPLPLGHLQGLVLARAGRGTDVRHAAGPGELVQHGGVVTALVVQAFRSGLIDGAVLSAGLGGVAVPVSVADERGVRACGGSRFALAPTVAEVNGVLRQESGPLAVVALPCQATALRRMRDDTGGVETVLEAGHRAADDPGGDRAGVAGPPGDRVSVVIGLFCTWALGQRAWADLRAAHAIPEDHMRVDIPPPPAEVMVVEVEGGREIRVPLERVRAAVRPPCRVCADMTAEHADISVGMAEDRPGWNTVIVRSPAGRKLFEEAVASGAIDTCVPDPERVEHLSGASLGKKRRAVVEARAWPGDTPYLQRLRACDRPGWPAP